jgi:DNA adenine methylase
MTSNAANGLPDNEELTCKPFVKWAGGKGQLLHELIRRIPSKYNRYLEPFIGGGALYFALKPTLSSINDLNGELISCYQIVRDAPDELIKELSGYPYESEFYYRIRALDRSPEFMQLSPLKRAARLIYLNKTCFNGLFRVNSKGQFNVPFGKYSNPTIADSENIRACSKLLKRTIIQSRPFDEFIEGASNGDFIYFDPPYAPVSATSDFTSYLADGFGETEQELLAVVCLKLNQLGVKWLVSNSNTSLTRELYRGFRIEEVSATRAINSKASKRGPITELMIRNY